MPKEENNDALIAQLKDLAWEVRQKAADALAEKGPEAKDALDALWEGIGDEDPDVHESVFKAIVAIQGIEETQSKLWEKFREADLETASSLMEVIVQVTANSREVVDQLVKLAPSHPWKKAFILSREIRDGLEGVWKDKSKAILPSILELLRTDNLGIPAEHREEAETEIRDEACNWLKEKADEIRGNTQSGKEVSSALLSNLRRNGQGFEAFKSIAEQAEYGAAFDDNQIVEEVRGGGLLNDESELTSRWGSDKKKTLKLILAAMERHGDWEVRKKAADWLKEKAEEIPKNDFDCVVEALRKRSSDDYDTDVQNSARLAEAELFSIKQKKKTKALTPLLKIIQNNDEDVDTRVQTIEQLAKIESTSALRALARQWVEWIAYGDQSQLVEEAADKMRYNKFAVLPLIDQLETPLPSDVRAGAKGKIHSELESTFALYGKAETPPITQEEAGGTSTQAHLDRKTGVKLNLPGREKGETPKPQEGRQKVSPGPPIPKLKPEPNSLLEQQLEEWLASLGDKAEKYSDRYKELKGQNKKGGAEQLKKEMINYILRDRLKERELHVYRRIARQLADMSDERFFKKDDKDHEQGLDKYNANRDELTKHAILVVARRLPDEPDVDIRESLAHLLGNLGGREAVEALARAVVGEERTRAARQDLLAKYYLEPSKKRSEDAAVILKGAIGKASKTLDILQVLNILMFAVGLAVVFYGLYYSMQGTDNSQRVVGGLAAVGGLGGVITLLLKKPLEQIQNAMANLVQIETAFTSFIWELNLNGTYIQSKYVAEGILTNESIAQTIGRIEDAMSSTMSLVAIYTEEGGQRIVARINTIFPAVGTLGETVTISGQHLQRDSTQKKEHSGVIAINHIPINAECVARNDHEIKYKLPKELSHLNIKEGTIWVSLFIDGLETNALPFLVVKPADGEKQPPPTTNTTEQPTKKAAIEDDERGQARMSPVQLGEVNTFGDEERP